MKFAVLGTGHWAAETHAVAISEHPDTELVCVWGRDHAKATALAERFGARAYPDVEAALADVDAVAIALPPAIQAPLASRAARAGKHLLLDKPLALTIPAADDVVNAVAEGGVANVVFFTNRFIPKVTDFLVEMAPGEWNGARVAMLGGIFGAGSPYRDSIWRKEYGGLWDLGPHALSLLIPVLGPVATVTAAPAPYATTHVIAGHTTGATSTMALSLATPPGAEHDDFTFFGTAGSQKAPAGTGNPVPALRVAIDELLEQIRTGRRDHPCGVRFAREVTAVLDAAQRSSDAGVRIDISPLMNPMPDPR
jgi:predicted dehydrogenase